MNEIIGVLSKWFYAKAIDQARGVNGGFNPVLKFRVWCLLRREGGYVFILKLPAWSWAYDNEFDRWCWHQRRLMHSTHRGWKLYLYPEQSMTDPQRTA